MNALNVEISDNNFTEVLKADNLKDKRLFRKKFRTSSKFLLNSKYKLAG